MPRGADDLDLRARHADPLPVLQPPVRLFGMGHLPQHVVAGMKQHRAVQPLAKLGGNGHVVVVAVGADDRGHVAAGDGVDDRTGLVCGIDDHHVAVITDQPDVVVDVPGPTVQRESSFGDDTFNAQAHSTTTERSTSPRCMVSNACSTWSSLMRSLTNLSSGRRPCSYRSTSGGKSC